MSHVVIWDVLAYSGRCMRSQQVTMATRLFFATEFPIRMAAALPTHHELLSDMRFGSKGHSTWQNRAKHV